MYGTTILHAITYKGAGLFCDENGNIWCIEYDNDAIPVIKNIDVNYERRLVTSYDRMRAAYDDAHAKSWVGGNMPTMPDLPFDKRVYSDAMKKRRQAHFAKPEVKKLLLEVEYDLRHTSIEPLVKLARIFDARLTELERENEQMSTNDVPGAKVENGDALAMGCWAEHEDGSMIFVESTEGSRVVYSVFDVSRQPPIEYRDAMAEASFKSTYSWGPGKKDKWTWHDKTPFDWNRVIKSFSDGARYPSREHVQTAAERIADNLELRGAAMAEADVAHRAPQLRGKLNKLLGKIKRALDELPSLEP